MNRHPLGPAKTAATPRGNVPVPEHRRLNQLDGLRAIAILLVIVQHSGFRGLGSLGWIGVHLFFVLSGFLITGILRRQRQDVSFWRPFYIKRSTRILPPLVLFFLFCAFAVSIDWKTTGLAYIFFGANIVASMPHVQVNELTVLWSLAVEEHFYFLWPIAVRFLSRRHLLWILAATLVLDPLLRAIATLYIGRWQPIYFLTPFQLDGLAAGALLAVLVEDDTWRSRLRRSAGPLAVVTVLVFAVCAINPSFVREADSPLFNSLGYSLIVLGCAFFLAHIFLKPHSLSSRALSLKPMVFLGSISYGLYLFAGPVMHSADWLAQKFSFHHGHVVLVAGLTAAVLTSWISFRFYESPLVRWGRRRAAALSAQG